MADDMARSPRREKTDSKPAISRRKALAGAAALIAGTAILPAEVKARTGAERRLIDIERQLSAASRDWCIAVDAVAFAELALAELDEAGALYEVDRQAALTQLEEVDATSDRVCRELNRFAFELCVTPAETLPGLAVKAMVALHLEFDGLAELVLADLVRFAGGRRD